MPHDAIRPQPPQDLSNPSTGDTSFSPSISNRLTTSGIISPPQPRPLSQTPSPFAIPPSPVPDSAVGRSGASSGKQAVEESAGPDGWADWNNTPSTEDESDLDMPSDLRPSIDRQKSHQPLLGSKDGQPSAYDSPPRPPIVRRRSTFHERDPEIMAAQATRRRYTYAAFFLVLSLISFAVQTETAVYIQSQLHWEKAYCML
jgi:hypothetical protein